MRQARPLTIIAVLVVIGAAAVLFVAASESLYWRYVHDSPLMIYAGFRVAAGSVPYRDFFDMNMPGTYLVMAAMGRVFGWDDLGFRVFDLLCLATISVSTFLWMRRFGSLSAVAASVAFPLWYLSGGPTLSLQREYLALVPFAGLLAVATADTEFNPHPQLRLCVAGVLVGVAALIKPQFVLLSLPPLLLLAQTGAASVTVPRRIAVVIGGMSVPIGTMFLYLLCTGSLGPFVDMAVNYWPLYTHLTGEHAPIQGLPRLIYIVKSTMVGLTTFYAPMALVGLISLGRRQLHKRYAWMLAGLLGAAGIYPAVSGQFWPYHWIPFYYVALCAASSLPSPEPIKEWSIPSMAPAATVICLLLTLSSMSIDRVHDGEHTLPPRGGVPDEISGFLRSHMNAGDAVQPLDWTGGAVHGMLMARAPLATRFMYDFHFYHHISSPYIGKLRRDFMRELVAKKPRFVIQVLENKPWPIGADTTREFPELQVFLEQDYGLAKQGATYRILQRID